MTFTSEQTTAQMGQLFEQARRYVVLQKDYLSLHGVEVLTRLFTTLALVAIFVLVGFLVTLFGSFALAYWLGELLNSTILGFTIIAAALLLVALLIYANRKAWIILPTTRFLVSLLASNLALPTQEGIAAEKEHLRQQLQAGEGEMKDTAGAILAPMPIARNRWESASQLLQNGWNIYRGLQLGISAVTALRAVFGLGRKRRR
ncbi:MAG: hypothetical protein IJ767_05625 [Bacteroidaceae bacterium]|nr:hypothetical protein [Bacteroidaceae bacterium]